MNGRAYYNEIDPFAAQWLRNLIDAGHIAPGDVDERSIVDIRPDDLRGYTQCHFFAGIGGWSYALRLAGWPDDRPVWTGSCPCQPFSLAGKQKGFADERHLWPVWRELIRECDPAVVFGEQVASATEWLGLVRSDLEEMGRAVGAMPVQAASAGADHLRDRYWFVAYADDTRSQGWELLPERAGERLARPDGLADAARDGERRNWQSGASSEPQVAIGGLRSTGTVADAPGAGSLPGSLAGVCSEQEGAGPRNGQPERRGSTRVAGNMEYPEGFSEREQDDKSDAIPTCREARSISGRSSDHLEWVIGADGKARRVKSGIRLLAHGVPNRVGLLRGFGNAIDPRPAVEFILAANEAIGDLRS